MPTDSENGGWNHYELLVLSKLDDLKSSQDKFNQKFEEHVASDTDQFNAIHLKLATQDAVQAATANTKAKFWGIAGGCASFVGGVFADWLLFGRGH